MQPSPKYHIHAEIRTSGVVERSDVVGAIFGQTEGLLGDELDLRDLQEASKIGRIDVSVDSEGGRSFGTVTIASGLDRVETAVLAAALETIERVGPCRADCTIIGIEDARAAKRRKLVDRATDLLADIEEETMTSENLIDAVRQRARVEDITEYEGIPAGPRVADSDAIIVVEGRADVRRLLRFGIKNAIGVEGTDIPDAVASLTRERTTTAFLDGDRGGDLILQELEQVGDVDYVAFAPSKQSVEDLDRSAIMAALRKKVPYDQALDADSPREAFAPTPDETPGSQSAEDRVKSAIGEADDEAVEAPPDEAGDEQADAAPASTPTDADDEPAETRESSADGGVAKQAVTPAEDGATAADVDTGESDAGDAVATPEETTADAGQGGARDGSAEEPDDESAAANPQTLDDHIDAVIGADTGQARLLDAEFQIADEVDAEDTFDTIADAEEPPHSVVLDGAVTQRLLDVTAQRGVGQIIGRGAGEFVKQPASVRVRTVGEGDESST
jgi:DNA primase